MTKVKRHIFSLCTLMSVATCGAILIPSITNCAKHQTSSPAEATKIVIDDASNGEINFSATLNMSGSRTFHAHNDVGEVPINLQWSIATTYSTIFSIDSSTGILSWTNNLDPDLLYSFTLSCADENNRLASDNVLINVTVAQTPGSDVCPNSWFQINADGALSLKSDVDKGLVHRVIIPNSIGGTLVSSIQANTFSGCTNLSFVDFSLSSAHTINDGAFQNCSALISISLGSSIVRLGNGIFSNCSNLAIINLGSIRSNIPTNCFRDCRVSSITYKTPTVLLDTSYVLVDENGNVQGANIEKTVTNGFITQYKYVKTTPDVGLLSLNGLAIGNIKIPSNVIDLGLLGFQYNNSLTSVDLGASINGTGYGVFSECPNLTRFVANFNREPMAWDSNAIYNINSYGTVTNNDSSYDSYQLLTYLQQCGLPGTWIDI